MAECDNTASEEPLSFEGALARLETIVHDLEEGQIGLAEALACYEQGVELLRRCHALLENAERKIELLTGADAQGRPVAEPFSDAPSTSLAEKSAARSRRRTDTRPKAPPSDEEPPFDMDSAGALF
jgi:exodeoxyribonuclease VII small subunit